MEDQENSPPSGFRFTDSTAAPADTISKENMIEAGDGSDMVVVSAQPALNLNHAKAIDLIGEEFVSKLKADPDQAEDEAAESSPVTVEMTLAGTGSSETTTVTAGGEQSHLVYCNLNDLDLSGSQESYSLASLHSLAEASSTVQQQERNPYSAVSTILLQGGILQVNNFTAF